MVSKIIYIWLSVSSFLGTSALGQAIFVNSLVFNPNSISRAKYCTAVLRKQYFLTDHLNSVRSSISEHKTQLINNSQNYYPYGSILSTHTLGHSDFGFQGKRTDNELKGQSNSYDFHARIYDPKAGRWLSADPLEDQFPSYSTYQAMNSNPIVFVDTDGKSASFFMARVGKHLKKLKKISKDDLTRIEDAAGSLLTITEKEALDDEIIKLKRANGIRLRGQKIEPKYKGAYEGAFWRDVKSLNKVKHSFKKVRDSKRKDLKKLKTESEKMIEALPVLDEQLSKYAHASDEFDKKIGLRRILGLIDEHGKISPSKVEELFPTKGMTEEQLGWYQRIKDNLAKGNGGALDHYLALQKEGPLDHATPEKLREIFESLMIENDRKMRELKDEISADGKLMKQLEDAFIEQYK